MALRFLGDHASGILLKIEKRLGFNHSDLVRIGSEGVNVQFGLSCLVVDIAERLKAIDFKGRKLYEDTAIAGELFEVDVTLPVEVGAHFFNLEIGHVAKATA